MRRGGPAPWEGFQLITCRGSCMQNSNGIVLLFGVSDTAYPTHHRASRFQNKHLGKFLFIAVITSIEALALTQRFLIEIKDEELY